MSTISDAFQASCERYPESLALIDGERKFTFTQLRHQVLRLASLLQELGVDQPCRVTVQGINDWRYEVVALACWWNGAIVIPLSGDQVGSESSALKETLEPALTLAISGFRQTTMDWYANGRSGTIDLAAVEPSPPTAIPSRAEPESVSTIIFTSGSSGQPKGVQVTHNQIIRCLLDMRACQVFRRGDRILVNAPFSHTFGLFTQALRSLVYGVTQVLNSSSGIRDIVKTIISERVTVLSGTPSFFQLLLRESVDSPSIFSSVRVILTGGSDVSPSLYHALKAKGVNYVFVGYGLSECMCVCGTGPNDNEQQQATTVGRPMPDLLVKIVDHSGNELPPDVVGEIWVSGYGVFPGYFQDENATLKVVTEDGWLRTGDLGSLNHEGYLQITGREKDMYICHGHNVYPARVEDKLLAGPLTDSVAVVSRIQKIAGEVGVAFVVLKDNGASEADSFRQWARSTLARHEMPSLFIFTGSLPLNRSGKVDKLALKLKHDIRDDIIL